MALMEIMNPADCDDPLALYDAWLDRARQSEPNDPNAAALATATSSGAPSVRMVLIKPTDGERFCFYTNGESRKGRELGENPRAALCIHWKSLRRQVRIEGSITALSPTQSDTYFHSRSRLSQIGAAVSRQSGPLESRERLESEARAFATANTGEIPRPERWRGYRLQPESIEFWVDGPDRLHDRFLFTMEEGVWRKSRLYP